MTLFAIILISVSGLLLLAMAILGLFRRRLSSFVFFATGAYAFIAVANASALIRQFSEERYLQIALIYFVGTVVLSLSTVFFSKLIPKNGLNLPLWNQQDFHQHALYATFLAILSLIFILLARGSAIFLSWSDTRISDGFLTALSTLFFMLACPGLVSVYKIKHITLGILLFLLCIFLFIVIGSRASLLGAPIFAMWLLLSQAQSARARIRIAAIAFIIVLMIHTLLRVIRGAGISGLLQAVSDGNLSALFYSVDDGIDFSGGESDMPMYLMFAMGQSSIEDFGFMTSIQRLFLLPIPSINGWISKPLDVTNILWKKAFEGGLFDSVQGQAILLESFIAGSYGSLHPTLFGEYFLAGGWVGLVLSLPILGGALVTIDLIMNRANRMTSLALSGPILIGYLFVARGNSVVGFGYFVYLGAMVVLLRYVMVCSKKCIRIISASVTKKITLSL